MNGMLKKLYMCFLLFTSMVLIFTVFPVMEVEAADTGPSVKYAWYDSYNKKWVYGDAASNFPSLVNAKSIAIDTHEEYGGTMYIHYWNNTVKFRVGTSIYDATSMFPSLVNAKSIAVAPGGYGYVLYTNNTVKYLGYDYVKGKYVELDATSMFPNLENTSAVTFDQSGYIYLAYFDQPPTLNVTLNNQTAYKAATTNTLTLSGTVSDPDNDNVTISATVAGVTKTTTVSNTATAQNWTLQWNAVSDNLPAGTYSNIAITAKDPLWGSANATFTGNLVVDTLPNVPSALNPGSMSATTPTLVGGLAPSLFWAFTDPDAGDYQSAYNVQIYNAAGTTLIHDTGWVSSGSSSSIVPANKLARGTVYSWKVAVKDRHGGTSAYSPLYYFTTNTLPIASITSYIDGQQMDNNILSMIWTYTDADGQAQTHYRVQGSRDNWATIGYDSGVMSGSARSMTLPALAEGTWNLKVTVYDGMEWSNAATRINLKIPNANDIQPPTMRGELDIPAVNQEVSGIVNGSGWALDMNGVQKIEMMVDGVVKATAFYGDLREDIYNMYPNYNNHHSGFHFSLDTRVLTNGTHTLSILETSNTNIQTLLTNKTVTVNNSRAATIVSNNIPLAMQAGQEYPITVTVRNDGSFAWSEGLLIRLGGVGDSDPFTSARKVIATGQTVEPGQSYTFTFTMKAPSVAGNHTTDWQMVQDGIQWFGQVLSKTVIVSKDFTYYYDAKSRLDYIQTSSGKVIDYQYDANGNLVNIVYP